MLKYALISLNLVVNLEFHEKLIKSSIFLVLFTRNSCDPKYFLFTMYMSTRGKRQPGTERKVCWWGMLGGGGGGRDGGDGGGYGGGNMQI